MIGQWIKESRESKGMTQDELAEQLYTSRQNIVHYESGKRKNPTLNTLRDFSRALDLTILIEKGEVIYMKNETGIQQTIEAFRHRLIQQFKYVHQITVSEMVGQIIDIAEQEFGIEYPTWRGFLPKEYWGEVLNPRETDWVAFFSNPNVEWGRFEFDIEIKEAAFIQGVTFNIENPLRFAEIMSIYLPQTDEEWEDFSDYDLWVNVIDTAINQYFSDELGDLVISNIQIEQ